jgi:hypothetical protein
MSCHEHEPQTRDPGIVLSICAIRLFCPCVMRNPNALAGR